MAIFPRTSRVDEEVSVFLMKAQPVVMWEQLEAHPILKNCLKGIYAPDHHLEPIFDHMRMNGVVMEKDIQRLFLEEKKPWHFIVTETYKPYVMDVLEKVPIKCRAVVRDQGSFTISAYTALQPGWRLSDVYTADVELSLGHYRF